MNMLVCLYNTVVLYSFLLLFLQEKMTNKALKIGLFYGSTTCYTEMAAEKIQVKINELLGYPSVELFNIKDVALSKTENFDTLIFGISTWDFGEIQEDWESTWQDIANLSLVDKTVAIFGLGDQLGYADWFQDAVGMLHDELAVLGCDVIGYWPNQGYDFTQSKALTEDNSYFVGLSLDDENQYDLTDERIDTWCEQILAELDSL
jgi:flavodoxin II